MERRVLLIGKQSSFMFNAITKGLEKSRFKVETVPPDTDTVDALEDVPPVFVLYLGDLGKVDAKFFSYISLKVDNQKAVLYLVGNAEELRFATAIIGKEKVHESFLRPLDVNVLVDKINAVMEFGAVDDELKKKILIIDDDGAMLRMMKTWLSVKYQVYMASSGVIGINFLNTTPVDLVLLDYEMPKMSGPEVLKSIRADENLKDTPVIFLTAKDDKESVMTAVSLKPEKYLLKSMPQGKLIGAIDDFFTVLENKKQR